ncbi:MAG TPA: bacterial transcriptional activator domain-containing protein, partial [Chloroflexia bacterium]|nr:bacterial transcriptional activator domain-containing protein [Chloroflexia bacterium]
TYAGRLLAVLGQADAAVHPGYQLRVQTLGGFRVWRGSTEVGPGAWPRDKARQLFQLLLTERGRWMQREALVDRLWPMLAPAAAGRDFKVALNALNRVLEPGRSADAPFAYVVRDGTTYRLRPEADLWLDAVAFEQAATLALQADGAPREHMIPALEAARALYTGDYLPEACYEDWATAERERLRGLYLRVAERLADAQLAAQRPDLAVILAEEILSRDPCWERAYQLLMRAHLQSGNRAQAVRTYARCQAALAAELGVAPGVATTELYTQAVAGA